MLNRALFLCNLVDTGEDFGAVLLEGDDLGRVGLHFNGIFGLSKREVELRKNLHVAVDVGTFVGDKIREFGEDAPDFLFFLQLQFSHVVVLLDHGQRFDKECRAARRLVVNDSLDLPFVFRAHWNNVAALALGDNRLLQIGDDVTALHKPVQGAEESVLGHPQLGADPTQFGGGAIYYFGTVVYTTAYLADYMLTRFDGKCDVCEAGKLTVEPSQSISKSAGAHERRANFDQFGRNQDTSPLGFCDQVANVVYSTKVDIRLLIEQPAGLAGLLHPIANRTQVVAGQQRGR